MQIIYVHGPADLADIEEDSEGQRIYLCSAGDIELLAQIPIDLVTNTGSLQEMTDGYVSYYMSWLERSRVQYFYSSNYFAQPIDSLMEGMNYAAPVLGSGWRTILRKLWGDLPRPVAEMMFVRETADYPPRLEEDVPLTSVEAFLGVFDRLRAVNDPGVLSRYAQKAVNEMPYVPKEALFLARRAHALAGRDAEMRARIAPLLDRLERKAHDGISSMGLVDPIVSAIRNRLALESSFRHATFRNALHRSGNALTVEIDGDPRRLRSGRFGVLEQLNVGGPQRVSGWTYDEQSGEAPVRVHVFACEYRVAVTANLRRRPEFGPDISAMGFECEVEAEVRTRDDIRVFAEFADGSLGIIYDPLNRSRHIVERSKRRLRRILGFLRLR